MHRTLVTFAMLVMGCGGDDGGTGVDAPTGPRTCTGVAYDPCKDVTTGSDCMGGLTCREFRTDGFVICTPTCSASNPCPPDKDGNAVTCNGMGRCKAEPNACTP